LNIFFLDISSLPSFLSPSTITVLDLTSRRRQCTTTQSSMDPLCH
jgi:hypothetical protein